MRKKTDPSRFTQREIFEALNNTVVKTLSPASSGIIPDARLRKLRTYALAATAPMIEHTQEGLLSPEELVALLGSAALYVHMRYVMGTENVGKLGGRSDTAKVLLEEIDVELL